MLRFLFGLLLGVIAGVGGTAYFFSTGGGDYLLASSLRVHRLEEDLHRVSQEREQIAKKLEETTALVEKMTGKFDDLERRFQMLESAGHKSAAEGAPREEPGEAAGSPS
ncbi:MAG: hypothetical protein HYZ72_10450 [Deltaproteobacteria bacterium]|nr:hypothetical protein [Deltaproteobacteria bacterium]